MDDLDNLGEMREGYMLSSFITDLQKTLKDLGDMPVSKLRYMEDENGTEIFEFVEVCGFCVKEHEVDESERILVMLDEDEVDLLNSIKGAAQDDDNGSGAATQ